MFVKGSGSSTLVSTDVCQFVPENTIFIHSNLSNDGTSDILQEVFNQNQPPFGYMAWTNPCPLEYSKPLSSRYIQNVSFSFTNENNLPLYFNGVSVSMTLMIYKSNDIYDKIEQFLKYFLTREQSQITEG
jgi:hypothetical protein